MHRALLAASSGARVGLAARLLRADELPVRRDDHEEDVRAMIVPSIAPTWRYAARGAKSSLDALRGERDERDDDDGERSLARCRAAGRATS